LALNQLGQQVMAAHFAVAARVLQKEGRVALAVG
jgi:hypothetical protein